MVPAKQQLALAKLSTGTMMLVGFGMYAYGANSMDGDFMITGMAPYTKAEIIFIDKVYNHIHYVKRQMGNFKSCTSYARFDPVSSLLAISARYCMRHQDQINIW